MFDIFAQVTAGESITMSIPVAALSLVVGWLGKQFWANRHNGKSSSFNPNDFMRKDLCAERHRALSNDISEIKDHLSSMSKTQDAANLNLEKIKTLIEERGKK